jgi:ER lumen protein retaining receptor
MLYMLVFLTRYLDFWWTNPSLNWYNFVFKIFYLTTSAYIIGIMLKGYARTREREKAWKMGMYCLVGSIVLSPFVAWIFPDDKHAGFLGVSFVPMHFHAPRV